MLLWVDMGRPFSANMRHSGSLLGVPVGSKPLQVLSAFSARIRTAVPTNDFKTTIAHCQMIGTIGLNLPNFHPWTTL